MLTNYSRLTELVGEKPAQACFLGKNVIFSVTTGLDFWQPAFQWNCRQCTMRMSDAISSQFRPLDLIVL